MLGDAAAFHGKRDGVSIRNAAGFFAVSGESSGTMKSSWEWPGGGGLNPAPTCTALGRCG